MPEISIVVPVYKVELYLQQCIDSILTQTFSDFELILVDDGSPDNCGAICDDYAEKDHRIRVIHQKNGGLSVARNNGIKAAQGRYLTFVDGDDCITNNYCQILYEQLVKTECDYAACRFQKFNHEIGITEVKGGNAVWKITNKAYLEMQLSDGFSACGKLYRSYIFDDHAFMPKKKHEDILFCCDLARDFDCGVCCTDAELYCYRQNDTGIMAQSKKRCSPDRVFAGRYLYETVQEIAPELKEKAFAYAVKYPWSFVDGIFVRREFKENQEFFTQLRALLRKYSDAVDDCTLLDQITKHRMHLFSNGTIPYGVNAYARLSRVYLYHLLKKDAYSDGHGI